MSTTEASVKEFVETQKKSVSSLRGRITKFYNEILLDQYDYEAAFGKFQWLKGVIDQTETQLKSVNVLAKIEPEPIINDEYQGKMDMIKEWLKKKRPVLNNRRKFDRDDVNLVPKFNGEITHFQTFIKSYNKFVETTDADEDTKVSVLNSLVSGEPKLMINSCRDYQQMMETLKKEYGDQHAISNYYLTEIDKIPAVRDKYQLNEITELLKHARLAYLAIQTIGMDNSTIRTIRNALILKLPDHVELPLTDNDLKQDIDDIITILERYQKFARLYKYELKSDKTDKNKKPNDDTKKESTPKSCQFCGKPHSPFTCTEKTLEERRKIVKEKKLCVLCLKPGHKREECRSKFKCHCGERHSSKLCAKPNPVNVVNANPINPNDNNQAVDSDNSTQSNETSDSSFARELFALNAAFVPGKRQLRSLWVDVLVNQIAVKALYDPGAQLSLMRESFAETLRLKQFSGTEARIFGVGTIIAKKVVKTTVQYNNEQRSVYFYVVPNLPCEVLLGMPPIEDFGMLLSKRKGRLVVVSEQQLREELIKPKYEKRTQVSTKILMVKSKNKKEGSHVPERKPQSRVLILPTILTTVLFFMSCFTLRVVTSTSQYPLQLNILSKLNISTATPLFWQKTQYFKAKSFVNHTMVFELVNPCELVLVHGTPGYSKDYSWCMETYNKLLKQIHAGCPVEVLKQRNKRSVLALLSLVPWNYVLHVGKAALSFVAHAAQLILHNHDMKIINQRLEALHQKEKITSEIYGNITQTLLTMVKEMNEEFSKRLEGVQEDINNLRINVKLVSSMNTARKAFSKLMQRTQDPDIYDELNEILPGVFNNMSTSTQPSQLWFVHDCQTKVVTSGRNRKDILILHLITTEIDTNAKIFKASPFDLYLEESGKYLRYRYKGPKYSLVQKFPNCVQGIDIKPKSYKAEAFVLPSDDCVSTSKGTYENTGEAKEIPPIEVQLDDTYYYVYCYQRKIKVDNASEEVCNNMVYKIPRNKIIRVNNQLLAAKSTNWHSQFYATLNETQIRYLNYRLFNRSTFLTNSQDINHLLLKLKNVRQEKLVYGFFETHMVEILMIVLVVLALLGLASVTVLMTMNKRTRGRHQNVLRSLAHFAVAETPPAMWGKAFFPNLPEKRSKRDFFFNIEYLFNEKRR